VDGKTWYGLAFGLSGYLLNATGFDVEMGGAQTSSTFFWMRFVDVAIPVVASAIAIFAVGSFKITEERSYEIRTELEKRRAGSAKTEAATQGA
jgi:GPH family glycoside/pentoside/hexuronide:cation symporter